MKPSLKRWQVNLDICRRDHGRAQQRKGGACGLIFCSSKIIPKVEEMRRCCKRTNEKTLTGQREQVWGGRNRRINTK
jgi:hypothetical protein